jgi:hypothetical protein
VIARFRYLIGGIVMERLPRAVVRRASLVAANPRERPTGAEAEIFRAEKPDF